MSPETWTTTDTMTSPTSEMEALAAALYRLEFTTDLYDYPRSVYTERYEERARRLLEAGWVKQESREVERLRPTRWPLNRRRFSDRRTEVRLGDGDVHRGRLRLRTAR